MKDPIAVIKKRLKKQSMRSVAKEMGVSAPYLCDVLKGNRAAGPKIVAGIVKLKETPGP